MAILAFLRACSLRFRSVGNGLEYRGFIFLFSVQNCLSHARACWTASLSAVSLVDRFRFSDRTADWGSSSGGSGGSRGVLGRFGCDFGRVDCAFSVSEKSGMSRGTGEKACGHGLYRVCVAGCGCLVLRFLVVVIIWFCFVVHCSAMLRAHFVSGIVIGGNLGVDGFLYRLVGSLWSSSM